MVQRSETEKKSGKTFILAITSGKDEQGKTFYHAEEFNRGIPLEQVITITRMWLKKIEQKYLDKFYDKN